MGTVRRDVPWTKITETLKKMAHHISYHDHDISIFKIETVLCIVNLLMPKVVEVDVHEASYLVYYSAGKTDMCSQLKVFFSWSITAHS